MQWSSLSKPLAYVDNSDKNRNLDGHHQAGRDEDIGARKYRR